MSNRSYLPENRVLANEKGSIYGLGDQGQGVVAEALTNDRRYRPLGASAASPPPEPLRAYRRSTAALSGRGPQKSVDMSLANGVTALHRARPRPSVESKWSLAGVRPRYVSLSACFIWWLWVDSNHRPQHYESQTSPFRSNTYTPTS